MLTIENFWRRRFSKNIHEFNLHLPGWSFEKEGLNTFLEAPLSLSTQLDPNVKIENSTIILVSAPGAVGKSTLARQVAFETGAIYLDLAVAAPVGANTISGGLARSNLYNYWLEDKIALLIDGLDEARLRVTQGAFEAFLNDIAEISRRRNTPTVIFGRTGAVQEAWFHLFDQVSVAVLEIGYYDRDSSINFCEARLRSLRPDSTHREPERRAIEALLDALRNQTESDGDRFGGYAPVLQAVADRVAQEGNPVAFAEQVMRGGQTVTLQSVVFSILDRERSKLKTLPFQDQKLFDRLYSPDEQIERLVSQLYKIQPPALYNVNQRDAQLYLDALNTWVNEHPFLDGSRASSVVFEAVICARALRHDLSSKLALSQELRRGAAANPFLSEFYFKDGALADSKLPAEHIGVVYASLRAQLSLGDSANLLIVGKEDGEEEDLLRAEVEISVNRLGSEQPRVLSFETEQTGIIYLGSYIEDVDIFTPYSTIEIGSAPEAILVAPVGIQSAKLIISSEKLIVEASPDQQAAAVFLEADEFSGVSMGSIPILRGATLAVSWPDAKAHPWTAFAVSPPQIDDPRLDEGLRRFRKFIISFRSHSKGALARFRDKIEHSRMTKGVGRNILNFMIDRQVLSLIGSMYYLDQDRLFEEASANYTQCMERKFDQRTLDFIRRALA